MAKVTIIHGENYKEANVRMNFANCFKRSSNRTNLPVVYSKDGEESKMVATVEKVNEKTYRILIPDIQIDLYDVIYENIETMNLSAEVIQGTDSEYTGSYVFVLKD